MLCVCVLSYVITLLSSYLQADYHATPAVPAAKAIPRHLLAPNPTSKAKARRHIRPSSRAVPQPSSSSNEAAIMLGLHMDQT